MWLLLDLYGTPETASFAFLLSDYGPRTVVDLDWIWSGSSCLSSNLFISLSLPSPLETRLTPPISRQLLYQESVYDLELYNSILFFSSPSSWIILKGCF